MCNSCIDYLVTYRAINTQTKCMPWYNNFEEQFWFISGKWIRQFLWLNTSEFDMC